VGELSDSNLVAVRLTSNQRVIIGSPAYLKRAGTPKNISDLDRHNCIVHGSAGLAGSQRSWALQDAEGQALSYKVSSSMECNDGSAVHDWVMAGHGLAVRSWWEVGDEVKAKQLITVLDEFAPPPTGVHAVFPARKHLPLRVRVWVDFLKAQFSKAQFTR
jgi:DNA-binding transcriptional LysR family regulator